MQKVSSSPSAILELLLFEGKSILSIRNIFIDRNYRTSSVPALKCKLTKVYLLDFSLTCHFLASEAKFKLQI